MQTREPDSLSTILKLIAQETLFGDMDYKTLAVAALAFVDISAGLKMAQVERGFSYFATLYLLIFLNAAILKLAAEMDERAKASDPIATQARENAKRERLNRIFTYFGAPRREEQLPATTTQARNVAMDALAALQNVHAMVTDTVTASASSERTSRALTAGQTFINNLSLTPAIRAQVNQSLQTAQSLAAQTLLRRRT